MMEMYLKPLYSETLEVFRGEIIETHGLMARIKPVDGDIYITGSEEDAGDDSYLLGEGEALDFVGEVSVCASGESEVSVKILYFDAL